MNDEFGDPATDIDAALLDNFLREALNDIPTGDADDAEAATAVQAAIEAAWPHGVPPTVDELTLEQVDDVSGGHHAGDGHDGGGQHDSLGDWSHDMGGGPHHDGYHGHGDDFDANHDGSQGF